MLEACVSSDKVNPIRAIFNLNGISISGKDIRFKDESAIESDSALICPIPVAFIINASKTKMLVCTADSISGKAISTKSSNPILFVSAIEKQDIRNNESVADIAASALRRHFDSLFLTSLSFDDRRAFGIYTPFDSISSSYFAICFPVSVSDEEFAHFASKSKSNYKKTQFEIANASMLKTWADLAFSRICSVRAARINQVPLLSDTQMEKIWNHIKHEYQTNLQKDGVKLTLGECPSTQDSFWLICLTYFEGQFVAKDAIGEFARLHNSSLHKDQQPRHLKGKNGFYLTTRYETIGKEKTPNGYHMLVTLKEPHPSFLAASEKRAVTLSEKEFDEIKRKYNYECATCHIHEGDIHPKWGEAVKLQQGHRDPSKALSKDNCIPQCQHCNQTTMARFVWNANGGVQKVNDGFWLENHMTEPCEEHMRAYFLHQFKEEGLIVKDGN